jgi:hypothetical protein
VYEVADGELAAEHYDYYQLAFLTELGVIPA